MSYNKKLLEEYRKYGKFLAQFARKEIAKTGIYSAPTQFVVKNVKKR